jgi:hypothetical protein
LARSLSESARDQIAAPFSTLVERQQTKWLVLGVGLIFGGSLALMAFTWPLGLNLDRLLQASALSIIGSDLVTNTAISLLFPLTLAISIARYRLFGIDVIICRTLVYSVLTLVLSLAYLGSVLVLQPLLTRLSGQGSGLATVLSTLAVAALFGPVRARVQSVIDCQFYRRKYDAAETLAKFTASARDETDIERLSARLVSVVDETMQPVSVGLWLRSNGA